MESRAAAGRDAPRQVVGNLQRSRTKRPRRPAQHQQSEHQAILRKFHGSPRARHPGPRATLSFAVHRAFLSPFAILCQLKEQRRRHRNGRRRNYRQSQRIQLARRSAVYSLLGAGPLGQGPQHHPPGPVQCSAQRRRSRKRSPHRTGQPGGLFLRTPRPGRPAANPQRHRRSRQKISRASPCPLRNRRGHPTRPRRNPSHPAAGRVRLHQSRHRPRPVRTRHRRPRRHLRLRFLHALQAAQRLSTGDPRRHPHTVARAPPGHRCLRTQHGRSQRPNRHRHCRLLSQPHSQRPRRFRKLRAAKSSNLAKPLLVRWPHRLRNDFRRRPPPRHREPIHCRLQRGRRRLSPDSAHRFPASRRLDGRGPYFVKADTAAGTGRAVRPAISKTLAGPL